MCAVFSLIAALATGSWMTPAATLPAVQAALAGTPAPRVQAKRARAPEQPAAVAPVSPSSNVIDAGGLDDVSRLRARGLAIPLAAVSASQLTDTYTQARAGGATHEALDIMAPRHTPVLAVEDGRVVKLFLSKAGGITLYQFDPGNEYVYYYAHLDRYADGVTEGDSVRKGQVIGYVGSTGNALPDAPHLHFAILRLGSEHQWWRGTPINPFLIWRNSKP
jgi:peptidoglycan LD-endopeptidase LytH